VSPVKYELGSYIPEDGIQTVCIIGTRIKSRKLAREKIVNKTKGQGNEGTDGRMDGQTGRRTEGSVP
jgi:hypothetical protein